MKPTTATPSRPLACVVMAGGMGTRMRSKRTKVLHPLCGRPILGWVLAAARDADADPLVVVTPPEAEDVRALLGDDARAASSTRRAAPATPCSAALEAAGRASRATCSWSPATRR